MNSVFTEEDIGHREHMDLEVPMWKHIKGSQSKISLIDILIWNCSPQELGDSEILLLKSPSLWFMATVICFLYFLNVCNNILKYIICGNNWTSILKTDEIFVLILVLFVKSNTSMTFKNTVFKVRNSEKKIWQENMLNRYGNAEHCFG
jgi:hypothetical protein